MTAESFRGMGSFYVALGMGLLGLYLSSLGCFAVITGSGRDFFLRSSLFLAALLGTAVAFGLFLFFLLGIVLPNWSSMRRMALALVLYLGAGFSFLLVVLATPGFITIDNPYNLVLVATWPTWSLWFAYSGLGAYCLPFD